MSWFLTQSEGCVVHEACSGAPLLRCQNNVLTYKQHMESLARAGHERVPEEMRSTLRVRCSGFLVLTVIAGTLKGAIVEA